MPTTCPICQSNQLEGTFFCLECGASLLPSRKSETTASLGSIPAEWNIEPATTQQPTGIRDIRLIILNSGRRLLLSLEEPILMGRQDSKRGFYPEIDLTPDGGIDGGVSRRHARLLLSEGRCYIEDLESANGTFVNRERITAKTPCVLQSGDEIRLGTVTIRIDLV